MIDFEEFFKAGAGFHARPYQARLAREPWPETLIIPTGFGKTAAVLAAWLWKRAQGDAEAPRRLVYCLPMRTLVEQTHEVAGRWVAAAKEWLDVQADVHVLMGGADGGARRSIPDWIMEPHRPAILIGTQDLLVSAALMRAYGATRFRWPVDFALLHNDAMWVFDEVQLAGATLPTSAQLEAFRRTLEVALPARTMWMSATLDPAWLRTVDFAPKVAARAHDLSEEDLKQAAHLWNAKKRLSKAQLEAKDIAKSKGLEAYAGSLAKLAQEKTKPGKTTLVFVNTVARAQAVFKALQSPNGETSLLLHSRFRPKERAELTKQIKQESPAQGRIIVATQALEAGVDITSGVMITEIAPWASLVQRFGRCNRNGECGEAGADVFWMDLPDDDNSARPYTAEDFAEARNNLNDLSACGPEALSHIKLSAPPRAQVIRRRDLLDLFDTEPDLSGFDIDISPYVRDADDTDVRLFWRVVDGKSPGAEARAPARDELCPAPIGGAKTLLRNGARAWLWDTLEKKWGEARATDLRPGMEIMIDAASGGYDPTLGFDALSDKPADVIGGEPSDEKAGADSEGIDDDPWSASKVRVSLAKHSAHVRKQATELCDALKIGERERSIVIDAALWHDLGKAHDAFVALTHAAETPAPKPPLAKWPTIKPRASSDRKYFRHELASALGYLAAHDWKEDHNLTAYLIAAHHGKVRMRIAALPKEAPAPNGKLFARGVHDGDVLPATQLGETNTRELTLDLDIMQLGEGTHGASWMARTQGLLRRYGPFRLAWLEALVRIADWRASREEEAWGADDV